MARIKQIFLDGEDLARILFDRQLSSHPVLTIIVEDGEFERHITLSDQIESHVFRAGEYLASNGGEYADVLGQDETRMFDPWGVYTDE